MPFASDFERMCSEFSVLSLRIEFWKHTVESNLDHHHDHQKDHDISNFEATATHCMSCIVLLAKDLEKLRNKYEVRLPLTPSPEDLDNAPEPINTVQHRIHDNQQQKSYLAIIKWTLSDGKTFQKKLKQLRVLVDGLEDISKIATGNVGLPRRAVVASDDPPPYTLPATTATSTTRDLVSQTSFPRSTPRGFLIDPATAAPIAPFSIHTHIPQDAEALEIQHQAMMRHCGLSSGTKNNPRWVARGKLAKLTPAQFKEIRLDVYEEVVRRELPATERNTHLGARPEYHPKRNQARQKMAALQDHRFKYLVIDVLFTLESRFPSLQSSEVAGMLVQGSFSQPVPLPAPTIARTARPLDATPPPLLHGRAAHPSTILDDTSTSLDNALSDIAFETLQSWHHSVQVLGYAEETKPTIASKIKSSSPSE